jgi:serine/threonine protein kinase
MIDRSGRVVLTDFGIAKILSGNTMTLSGGMVGTPAFMSPEHGLGESSDERSDIYSMGVILYQMLTGRLPYDGDTPVAIILKHVREPLTPPSVFNPNIPPALEQIVMKAMAKDPEARYQSAAEMLADLNAFAAQLGQPAALPMRLEDTPARRAARSAAESPAINLPVVKRRSPLAVGAILILIVLGIFGVLSLANGEVPLLGIALRATETPTLTPSPSATPSATATDTPSPTLTPTPTFTPTPTPSATATSTPTPTATNTPTFTPTPTPSATLTPSNTPTPTPNITATIEAATIVAANATATVLQQTIVAFFQTQRALISPTPDYTATARLCVLEYELIAPEPPDPLAPKNPIRANTALEAEVILRNTGNCDWLPGTSINYVEGERFNLPRRIEMSNTQPVRPGEEARFPLRGRAPSTGGVRVGQWEVRNSGGVLIPPRLSIAFFVFQQ